LAARKIITRTGDKWYLGNPVNPLENFADRWHENGHRRAKAFFTWVSWVRQDLVDILDRSQSNMTIINESLAKVFGSEKISKASGITLSAPAVMVSGRHEPPYVEIKKPSKAWSDA
jgi:hypothetical protein